MKKFENQGIKIKECKLQYTLILDDLKIIGENKKNFLEKTFWNNYFFLELNYKLDLNLFRLL